MCGIIGIASVEAVINRDYLRNGREAIAHRGPDSSGEWWSANGRVGLGHRRLAIIDLSPTGNQPMQDDTGTLTIVLNGEIYNYLELRCELQADGYSFRSQSDTEVLLMAYRKWGTGCLSHLNGMFAFALYDHTRQTLFLARDRVGEKPLFYALAKGEFRFASEIKGLLVDPAFSRRIDPWAFDCYLTMGYVPGDRCIFQGVNKLPPAHAMVFDLQQGTVRVWRYWQLPAVPLREEPDLLMEFERLLEDAVKRQMLADVPVGILLSGGVDSSLVTAMAARSSRSVKTFTVSFPGFGPYDESKHARLIADFFDTDHTELETGQVHPEILSLLARQYDEPIIDSSMLPTFLISQLIRKHCPVVLGGDGGDELFGGYPSYSRLLKMQRKVKWIPSILRRKMAGAFGLHLPTGFKGRNWFKAMGADFGLEVPLVTAHFDAAERKRLLGDAWPAMVEDVQVGSSGEDLLQRATRMDFVHFLTEDILVKVDRASMLSSLEMRAPLLDYRIVEFALGRVPSHLKANENQRKIFLKALTNRVLPPQFDQHRKQGFSIPLPYWLKAGPWRDFFHDILLDEQCLFNKKAIKGLLLGQDLGMVNNERLFGLVMFELWRREYRCVME